MATIAAESTMTTTTGGNSANDDDDDDDDGSVVVERAYVGDRYLDHEERYEVFVVKAAERPHLLRWPAAPRPPPSSSLEKMEEEKTRMIERHRLDDDDDENDDPYYDEKKSEEEEGCDSLASSAPSSPPPPLTDGTDLPGWRCRRIAPCMDGCRRPLRRSRGRRPPDIDRDYCDDDIENPFDGVLSVGAGSTLYRRESQPPFPLVVVASRTRPPPVDDGVVADGGDGGGGGVPRRDYCCRWHAAKGGLWFDAPPHPDRAVPSLEYDEACALVDDPREERRWIDGADGGRCDRRGGGGGKKITFFAREYEMANRPAKILGAAAGWAAMPTYGGEDNDDGDDGDGDDATAAAGWRDVGAKSAIFAGGGRGGWTFANLLSRFGHVAFRLSDGHGEMLPLSTYARYVTGPEGLSDDSPLGIYDSEFGDDGASSPTRDLADEYVVPRCFGQDLFDLADGDGDDVDYDGDGSEDVERPPRTPLRPPYRWILIGPERSGTGMHVDPLWTSAWVTVLQGRKRWLLFPPETPHELIGMIEGSPQIPSSIWFIDYYGAVTSSSWPEIYRPTEVEQYPGETVYVPAGWPHLVLNLELTVAVTHNYAPEVGPFLGKVWEEAARDEPDFARRWMSGLRRNGREDLASRMTEEGVD